MRARPAGRFAVAMNPSDRIRQAIDRVFTATAVSPLSRAHARCGPFLLALTFASERLAEEFLPAYIRAAAGVADLEILFSTADQHDLSSLVPEAAEQPRLLVEGGIYSVWQPGTFPVLFALDRQARRGIVWLPTGQAPAWVRSRPALALIHALSIETPWTALHGGAVGRGDRFALLAGKGRSGKTTASLACAKAGWLYAGDDYVLVDPHSKRVEPLYCSARLRVDLAASFRDLIGGQPAVSDIDGEQRHELSLAGFGERLRGGRIAAIFLPRRQGAKYPEFTPARRADAFQALLTATTIELPGWPKVTAEKIVAAIDRLPIFFVDTGTDPMAIPAAFADQLERI
jgi:hypothetical protein